MEKVQRRLSQIVLRPASKNEVLFNCIFSREEVLTLLFPSLQLGIASRAPSPARIGPCKKSQLLHLCPKQQGEQL